MRRFRKGNKWKKLDDSLLGQNKSHNNLKGFIKLFSIISNNKKKNRLQKVEKNINYINTHDNHGFTILMVAARYAGYNEGIKIFKLVLSMTDQCDIDKVDDSNSTALCHASYFANNTGSPIAVKMLIECGANPNHKGTRGNTPLMYFCNTFTPFTSIDAARYLLDNGANPNISTSNNGLFPLMIACTKYMLDDSLISLLLKYNVDIDKQNINGNTTLMATCRGNLDDSYGAIIILLDIGARVDITNNKGKTVHDILFNNSNKLKKHIMERVLERQ